MQLTIHSPTTSLLVSIQSIMCSHLTMSFLPCLQVMALIIISERRINSMGSWGQTTSIVTDQGSKEKLLISSTRERELGLGGSDAGDERLKPPTLLLHDKLQRLWVKISGTAVEAYEMGRSDPRKVVFAAKMGLALSLISLLIFWKESLNSISQNSIWAIMTVVVVFEFSIGATFNKGFNRALGTISAGALSVGIGQMSELTGGFQQAIVVTSIFIAGFGASYAKLYPRMKEYEYGFRVFLLTFCIVLVSGSSHFAATALIRLLLIACGAAICLVVNTCIYPIWAGEDLHKLVVKNFMDVASSLEGCVNAYIQCHEYVRVPSKILIFQASDDPLYKGYQSAVESASREETLMEFAMWEPPHGRYHKCKHRWNLFITVSGALRHCAFMVMAMHGCMLSEIQAPAELRQVFSKEIKRVGIEGTKVLRELGNKVEMMEKLSVPAGNLLQDVHRAAEQLQMAIDQRSYLLVNSASWEINNHDHEEEGGGGQEKEPVVEEDPAAAAAAASFLDHEEKPLLLGAGPTPTSWDDPPHDLHDQQPNMNMPGRPRSYPNSILLLSGSGPAAAAAAGSNSEDDVLKKQQQQLLSWPSRLFVESRSEHHQILLNEREARTYESATALSLGTFTSILIEFVARLQNLVDSFVELSDTANFKEPAASSSC
ncbi:hypothetical protein Dimus_000049 [Dionaea muscipula]